MKKTLVILGSLVFVFVLAGCNQPTATPTPGVLTPVTEKQTAAAPEATTTGQEVVEKPEIKITDSGFLPQTLTVKVGTVVSFMNTGTDSHQVASNPHPLHTDLPGFDSVNPIKPGDKYDFKFEKIGTWKYHDHLNPSVGGSVTVFDVSSK